MNAVVVMTAETEPTLRNGVPAIVGYRLERWAYETKANPPGAWPSVTVIGRMIEHGPGAGAEGPQVHISAESAEIDAIVAKMPQRLRQVIEVHYKTWQPPEAQAKQCRISLSAFRTDLRAAQWFVFARMQS